MRHARLICASVLEGLGSLPDESVQCVVTSPPYWGLRDYGAEGQLGLEATPALYLEAMVTVFREVRRVLRKDGTCWVNMGDCYANDSKWGGSSSGKHARALHGKCNGIGRARRETRLKQKDLVGMPWRLALALQEDGWWLRADIVWAKPNAMPESIQDRPSKSHEYIFLLTRSERYFYDAEAVRERADPVRRNQHVGERGAQGYAAASAGPSGSPQRSQSGGYGSVAECRRNLRTVWSIATGPFPGAHFATFPPEIPERCIRAGTSERGCCAGCGAPWRRGIEKTFYPQADVSPDRGVRGAQGQKPLDASDGRQGFPRGTTATTTTGWAPTCKCPGAEPVACAVLDSFAGAGTTLMVALRLNRRAIGIELSPEYCEMAVRRIEGDAPLLNSVSIEQPLGETPC